MSIREMTGNLNYHSSLPDQPTQEASELKQIWDQGVNDLKDYINDVLIPDMIAEFLEKSGGKITGNLEVTGTNKVSGQTDLGRLIVNALATFKGGVAINSSGTSAGLEIYGSTPYIDFHYGNASSDYTSRLIESERGVLTSDGIMNLKSGVRFNGANTFKILWNGNTGTPDLKVDNYTIPLVATDGGNRIRLNWTTTGGGHLEVYVDGTYVGYLQLSH